VETCTHVVCPVSFHVRRVLRAKLRDARTYAEWKEAAIEMDEHLGFDVWKSGKCDHPLQPDGTITDPASVCSLAEDEDSQYDWSLSVPHSLLELPEIWLTIATPLSLWQCPEGQAVARLPARGW
jgi:hypothetical protein